MSAVVVSVGVAWGVVAALPMMRRARRTTVAARFGAPEVRTQPRRHIPRGPVGRVIGGLGRRRRARALAATVERDLPMALDLLIVALSAGESPHRAVEIAARWAPRSIGERLDQVLVATGLGGRLATALADLAEATPQLRPLTDVLIANAELGTSARGALTRLADESRAHVRRRAEARARVLPVKLLFPLVFLVLPAFGLLTVAPALLSAMSQL